MAYNDLQQNQTISFNNLQSGVTQGVFTAKTTIPPGTKQITKTEANTYVNINTSLPTYAAKASNQLVTKEDLSGITSTSPYVMYGVAGTAAYKSTDGGNTFTALSGLTSAYNWMGIAGDSTGTYIAVVTNSLNLVVYLSSDGGSTFTQKLISGVFGGTLYPTSVAMSNNGQYIGIAGLTNTLSAGGLKQAMLVASSNYGSSFSTIYTDSMNVNMYQEYPFKISVSGNGQYMTAVYSYEVDPGGINVPRPWSFRIYSTNFGASWTRSGGSEFSRFFDIALDGTGQNQFLTTDWGRPGIGGTQGIKAFVTTDFGANWTERYSNTVSYFASTRRLGFTSATISDNGQVMVGATDEVTTTPYYNRPTFSPLVIASFNSGSTFAQSDGYNNNVAIAGGTAVTTGITNNYIAMMLKNIGQFNYSTVGGTTFIPKATTARAWNQIYRKALLNTPTTTTTTTTLGYALVDITNSTAGTDITNITVNGVQVDGAVFPIVAGDGASASTTQTGASRSIVVSYTNVSNDSVEVIDTSSNLNCGPATSTSRVFGAQVVSDGGTLFISMFDGSC
jgi:hypothetical protein